MILASWEGIFKADTQWKWIVLPSSDLPSLMKGNSECFIDTTNILNDMDHSMTYTKGRDTLDWTNWAVILKFPSHNEPSIAMYEILVLTTQIHILTIWSIHEKVWDNFLYNSL